MSRAGAGILRDLITVSRPSRVSDGRGGTVASTTIVAANIPARITVKRGGEQVQAQRLNGITPHDITVRYDATTAAIRHGDTIADQHGTTYSIKWTGCLDEGRPRWITIMAETGTVAAR
ncbi:head-tail adaptor protein [Sphingomonas sp. I4]